MCLAKSFNQTEFEGLCRLYGLNAYIKEVTINYEKTSFFNRIKAAVQKDRRGEAVFCVIRPDGRLILVTSPEYPKGVFRIPTGGIGWREDILKAVTREVKEELGLIATIKEFAGVLRFNFTHGKDKVEFYSYIFILEETGGRLLIDATDDEVSEIRELSTEELGKAAEELFNIKGRWEDWARFRFQTTNAVYSYLSTGKL